MNLNHNDLGDDTMTTPIPDILDWAQVLPQLKDVQSVRLVQRLVENQRQVLDTHVAQLGELSKQLEEFAKKMEGSGGATKGTQ
jgi:hypothetical protein